MAMAGDGDGDATYRRAFSRFFHAVTARADRWPKALLRACQDFSKRMRAAESNRGHVIKESDRAEGGDLLTISAAAEAVQAAGLVVLCSSSSYNHCVGEWQ